MSAVADTGTLAPERSRSKPRGRERLVALDVLRGIAILGTMATNIGLFLVVADGPYGGGADGATWQNVVSTATGLVTDGKWIGLLTIMFGIGLEIQRQAAYRRGDRWPGGYPIRALILVLDGLLNYFFIFEFDVLMGYGLTALVVCWVLATSPRVQKWAMWIGILAHVSFLTYLSRDIFFPRDAEPLSLEAVERDMAASDRGMGAGEPSSTYWGEVQDRISTFFEGGRSEIPIMLVMGFGLFLVGAHLFRAGIFLPERQRLRWWVMGLSFGIGLPIDFGTRIWFSELTGTYNRYLTSTFVSFGVLALVAHFYAKGRTPGLVGRALGRVGKTALTCYIGQNLIASLLFKPWGLDLGSRFDGFWGTYLAFALVATILIVFSTVWLRIFERGPVEWVWHRSYQVAMVLPRRFLAARRKALP